MFDVFRQILTLKSTNVRSISANFDQNLTYLVFKTTNVRSICNNLRTSRQMLDQFRPIHNRNIKTKTDRSILTKL